MATMNVSLPTPRVEFVKDMVASSGYSSSSEVVRQALCLLRHEREVERERAAILGREIGIGLEQAQVQSFSDQSVADIADGVMQRAMRR